jgi:hypothetical protein
MIRDTLCRQHLVVADLPVVLPRGWRNPSGGCSRGRPRASAANSDEHLLGAE